MKKVIPSLIVLILITTLSFASVDVGIDLSIFPAISTYDGSLKYNFIKTKFSFTSSLSDDASIISSLIARYNGNFNGITNVNNLFNVNSINPIEIYVDEAYIKVQKFIFDNVDLALGKQRISWGKADKINPTDVLNPLDMFDVLDFSSKFASLALNTKVYFNLLDESYFQLVLEPVSGVAELNSYVNKFIEDTIKENILESLSFLPNVSYSAVPVNRVITPDNNITNGLVGIKFASKFFGFDTSLSFAIRKNDIPYISSVYISNDVNVTLDVVSIIPLVVQTNTNDANVNYVDYSLSYYGERMVGFDVSKDFGFVLAWLEVGVFIPDEVSINNKAVSKIIAVVNSPLGTNTNIIYQVSNYSETYLKDAYTKYVFGFDKTFDDGLYINFQFAHGLGFERGFKDEHLQDYFILNLEKKFFDDRLKVRTYGIVNIDKPFDRITSSNPWDELVNNSGILGALEISYSPVIGANLGIRIIGIDGNGSSTLSRFKDFDVVGVFFNMEI